MIQRHFDELKRVVDGYAAAPFVLDAQVSFEVRPGDQGFVEGAVLFQDRSTLHFREYLDRGDKGMGLAPWVTPVQHIACSSWPARSANALPPAYCRPSSVTTDRTSGFCDAISEAVALQKIVEPLNGTVEA